MITTLLPCPFCGGSASVIEAKNTHAGIDMIKCNQCDCRVYGGVDAWNRRPELSNKKSPPEFKQEYMGEFVAEKQCTKPDDCVRPWGGSCKSFNCNWYR